jgi:hypothetical protein
MLVTLGRPKKQSDVGYYLETFLFLKVKKFQFYKLFFKDYGFYYVKSQFTGI